MSVKHALLFAVIAVVATAPVAYAQEQPEPYMAIGTWKLNPEKSTGDSQQRRVRSRIHKLDHRGAGVVVNVIEQVNAEGVSSTTYFTARADGTPYPMIQLRADGTGQAGRMTESRVDSHTIQWTIRNAKGEITAEGTRVVARDGKSYSLINKQGTLVYEKQP